MNELKARAVVVGAAVDIFGSQIVGLAFYAAVAAASGVGVDGANVVVEASPALLLTTLVLGLLMTAIGASVAARMAPRAERPHAFAVGIVSTLVGFLFVFSAPDSDPFWLQATGLILTIPAAFVGGEVARLLRRGGRTA